MVIDWTQAPKGTTHCTINGGEPRWYQETMGGMNCWNVANATWFQSFFSSPSDIEDNGLRLYANGEQSELVMLREQRDALLQSLKDLRQEFMMTLQENDIDPNYYLAIALSSSGRKAFVDSGQLITNVDGTK